MYQVHPKELEAVMALPTPGRYDYFIKKVVDWEEVWGLWKDGFASAERDLTGEDVFPLWPAKAFAEKCLDGVWIGSIAKPIALEFLLETILPNLAEEGTQPGVFYIPSQGSVDVTVEQLVRDLKHEQTRYG